MRTALILIVSYKNCGDVLRCLAALSRCEHDNFRITVCENGGGDAFAELTCRVPAALEGGQPVQLITAGKNLGYAGGVNFILDHSENADAYWVLNPDAVPRSRDRHESRCHTVAP